MTEKWQQVTTDEGDCYILPPGIAPDDMHSYYVGDMESVDGCCLEQASFVVKACNRHKVLLDACKAAFDLFQEQTRILCGAGFTTSEYDDEVEAMLRAAMEED